MSKSTVGLDGTVYIDALGDAPITSIALGIVMVHCRTGEEKFVDLLCADDRLATVFTALRPHFNSYWSMRESFEIEPFGLVEDKAAA